MSVFRELVDSTIEARRPLDTPDLARLAEQASPADRRYWMTHVRLDQAVYEWRRQARNKPLSGNSLGGRPSRRASAVWRSTFSVRTAAALAFGLSTVLLLWPRLPSAPRPETLIVSSESPARAEPGAPEYPVEVPQAVASENPSESNDILAMASPDRFAEATATAERLKYAFKPVGDQVETVMRFLIDSVPGSDVFSM